MSKKISVFGLIMLIALFWVSVYATPARAEEITPPENPIEENTALLEEEMVGEEEAQEEEGGTETEDVSEEIIEIGEGTGEQETALEENAEEEEPVETTPLLSVEATMTLPNGCEVEDTNGTVHYFPLLNSPSEYLAICALAEAKEEGIIEDFELIEFTGAGLFVDSINGIKEPDTFWALYYNEAFEMNHGVMDLALSAGDSISLKLTPFVGEPLGSSLTLHIDTLEERYNNIILPDHCSVTDLEGIVHEFPENDSPSDYLAICALVTAEETGHITGFELSDSDFGLFVQSVDGIAPGATEFWALWLNSDFALCGIECLPVAKGDMLSFVLTDWMANTETTDIDLRIISLVSSPDEDNEEDNEAEGGSGGGNGGGSESPEFSVDDAVLYLKSVQDSDGSFADEELYTDWAAIAYSAADVSGDARDSLKEYLGSNNSISSLLTDNERRAMALLALGENPYSFDNVNYIEAILEEFDGEQFGDPDLVNDDIFALIPLASSGYDEDDEVILKTIEFIISEQKENGSWEGSTDVTAAAIQALVPFDSVENVDETLSKAGTYIAGKQESDGGWENVFSTSWALQAENALGELWTNNGKTGLDYLATAQDTADNGGSVLSATEGTENAIWATSYAIPAGLGKTWDDIMESVSKPKNSDDAPASPNNDDPGEENNFDTEGEVLGEEIELPETTVPPANSAPILVTNTPAKPIVAPQKNETGNIEKTETFESPTETSTEEITAAAGSASPENSETYQYIYYFLGGASGLALLYLGLKSIFGF